ncbi:MAG: alpha-ketoacid dehydrogenase subunit beta [Planctomycetes bacterium]|nr:alpha-ketoacid dehydrogenase subunit beta [Planctomycetota bacterium]
MVETTYIEAIRRALREEMERDASVVLLGEDIGVYGGAFKATEGLFERFGSDRVMDTPLAESGLVGAAVGMSYMGFRPVVEFQFIDFIACGFDQVVNFMATSRYRWGHACPVVLRGPWGGGVRGNMFHSRNVEMWFAHSPGLKVVAPGTARDALGLLKSAIRDPDPVLYLEHKHLYRRLKEELPEGEVLTPIGKAEVAREGRHLTVVTYGWMRHVCLDAARELEKEGLSIEVLDLRSLYPLDRAAIVESVKKTNKLLIVHEDTRTGGIAGEVAMTVCEEAFDSLDGPILRVTAPDTPVPYSPTLEDAFLPKLEDVVRACRKLARY